jgi:6-phosphogluconolactonase
VLSTSMRKTTLWRRSNRELSPAASSPLAPPDCTAKFEERGSAQGKECSRPSILGSGTPLIMKRGSDGRTPMLELQVVDDIAAAAVARFVAAAPRTIALSGGSTPEPVYRRLAMLAFPWAETDVFFGDERCVPRDHPDSNYRMAWDALLSKVPARAHPMAGATCDVQAYERELRTVFGPGVPVFDLIFLGLGPEGHTASLFPGSAALDERERLVVHVERPDHERLTLTVPVLNAAKLVLFLVSGREKRGALQQLLAGGDIPAARVHAQTTIVLADADAAS